MPNGLRSEASARQPRAASAQQSDCLDEQPGASPDHRIASLRLLAAQHDSADANVLCGIREERHEACSLERLRESSLMPCARAGLPSRLDLRPVGEVSAEARDILEVDARDLVHAELAYAPAGRVTATRATSRAAWARPGAGWSGAWSHRTRWAPGHALGWSCRGHRSRSRRLHCSCSLRFFSHPQPLTFSVSIWFTSFP